MHKVLGAGNVGGEYVSGDPTTGQRPTALDRRDFNTVFRELWNLVEGADLTLNTLDDTQVLQAVRGISIGRSSLRNALINGDFIVQQRTTVSGISTNDANAFGPDRWLVNNNNGASGSVEISHSNYGGGAIGTTWPYANARSRGLVNCSGTALPNPILLAQRLEDVRTFSGIKCTLSFWVKKATSSTVTITPKLRQYHGSGGAADVTIAGDPIVLTDTTWQRHTQTFTVPAAGNVTNIGWPRLSGSWSSAVGHYLELRLEIGAWAGASCVVEITDIQLEPGSSAGTFERRPYDFEFQLCQRYYEKSLESEMGLEYFVANPPIFEGSARGQNGGTIARGLCTRFRVRKARVPTVKWYSPQTGAIDNVQWNGVDVAVTGTNHTCTEQTGEPVVGAAQTNSGSYAHWTADAEL
jgi:hypothetical protein